MNEKLTLSKANTATGEIQIYAESGESLFHTVVDIGTDEFVTFYSAIENGIRKAEKMAKRNAYKRLAKNLRNMANSLDIEAE